MLTAGSKLAQAAPPQAYPWLDRTLSSSSERRPRPRANPREREFLVGALLVQFLASAWAR
jgi:hypothetical protein